MKGAKKNKKSQPDLEKVGFSSKSSVPKIDVKTQKRTIRNESGIPKYVANRMA